MRPEGIPIVILILLTVAGCADRRSSDRANPPVTSPSVKTAEQPSPQRVCPTTDDVLESLAECRKLIYDADYFVWKSNRPVEARSDLVGSWKREEQAWRKNVQELIANSDLLVGADGTQVYPEIPSALKNLDSAGDNLEKALDPTNTKQLELSKGYIQDSWAATHRAEKLMTGKNSIPAIPPVPDIVGESLLQPQHVEYEPHRASGKVEFGPYMADVQRRIKSVWFPPKGTESKHITVLFKIHRDGMVSNLKLDHPSGIAEEDQAALKAIEDAAPFRSLPMGAPESVDMQFTFDYNGFGEGGRGVFHPF